MERLFLILSILSILLILVVLRSLRRERIRVEHSVSWLLAAVALLALSVAHSPLASASKWLGLNNPAAALMAAILIVFLGVFYRFSRVVSELKDMNITLVQRVAILEHLVEGKDGQAS